jgi:hypothetical protein
MLTAGAAAESQLQNPASTAAAAASGVRAISGLWLIHTVKP